MSVFEMVASGACVLIVGGAWWWAVTRPAFSEALQAWAKRHSHETDLELIKAWSDGYDAGREFEQLRTLETRK